MHNLRQRGALPLGLSLGAGALVVGAAIGWYARAQLCDGAAAELRVEALHAALVEQTRRLNALREAADDAAAKSRRAHADARAADALAGSLREHVARLAQRCSAPAAGSPAELAAGDVLADMLGRLEAAGRELAAEADRARVAGELCERSYDTLDPRAPNGRPRPAANGTGPVGLPSLD